MRCFTMRRLLPLALACLLAAQAVSAGRGLLATPANKKAKAAVPTSRKQYVQFAVSIQGKTCAELPRVPLVAGSPSVDFNVAFRAAMRADATNYITTFAPIQGFNAAAVIATIGTPGTNCTDWRYNDVNYAGVRAAVSFNGTNNTLIRDFLWDSTREGICSGKYRQDVWTTVAGLMATTGLTVRLNNGSRQNPFGNSTGWLPIPQLPCPTPKPSPNPVVPSPSPEAPVPSPSPAPGCGSIPNSVLQADGTCKCTNPLFAIEGTDGDKLVSCVSSSATVCPAAASTAVKDNSTPVPKLLRCITPATECPAPYTFPLYGQSPSTKMECRLPVVDCTYTPFTLRITDANGVLVGCVNPLSNACPFVAFRSAPLYGMEFCRKVDGCPVYSETPTNSTTFTVAGLSANRVLTACLTLTASNVCPQDIPAANYPVEVVKGDPTGCGAADRTCKYSGLTQSRVVECLATGAACDPAKYPLQIFKFVGAGAVVPTLVGCREARPGAGECNLTPGGMTASDPNAGSYSIPVFQTQANLVGCVVAGANRCPADYPVARRNSAGAIISCAPSNNAQNPCVSNSAEPVPLMKADGTWMGICVARTQSCLVAGPGSTQSYFVQFGTPVTIRNAIGDMIQCREQISTCPTTAVLDTDGTSAVFATFPLYNYDGKNALIASCYPPTAVGSTCTISADGSPLGTPSVYTVPIRSSAANSALQGCLDVRSPACPAGYPFTIMNGTQIQSCAPAGDLTSCPATHIPATLGTYPPVLVGCLILTNPNQCPMPMYPTSIATGINQKVTECMVAGSVCYKDTQPFYLFEELTATDGSKYQELRWCINPQQSITNCDQANPAISGFAAWQNAAEVYNKVGTSILGCVKRPNSTVENSLTICPVEFPFIFRNVIGATFQCRAGIDPATTCAGAVAGATAPPTIADYNVDVKDLAGTLIGCTVDGGSVCPPGGVIVSETATSPSEICLSGSITSCAGVSANGAPRTFPLYSGTNPDGSAKLVRCIAPVAGTDCISSAAGNFSVPVYSNADGTGDVVGCVRNSSDVPTPCPASAPFFLLSAGPNSAVDACILTRPACNMTSTAGATYAAYDVEIYTANKTSLLGCMKAATQCPTNPPGPYPAAGTTLFPVFNNASQLDNCQYQSPNAVLNCASFGSGLVPIIDSNDLGASAPVVGCAAPQAGIQLGDACIVPNFPVALYRGGVLVGCRPRNATCDAAGSGGLELAYINEGVLTACVDKTARRHRALLASGNVAGATNGCQPPSVSFWSTASSFSCLRGANITALTNTTCDPSLFTGWLAPYSSYTRELFNAANTNTLEGCMLNTAVGCAKSESNPLGTADYPIFVADGAGVIASCAETGPCPAGTTPVYNTDNTGAASPALYGCVQPAANTSTCPNWSTGTFPTGDFRFYLANGNTSGTVTGCFKNTGNNTCPPNYVTVATLSNLNDTQAPLNSSFDAAGCLSGGACLSTQMPLWDATSTSNAEPVLRLCVTGATPGSTPCADLGEYTVPLINSAMNVVVDTATTNAAGCLRKGASNGARCPTGYYPLIDYNVANEIVACFNNRTGGCTGTARPLCTASVQTAAGGGSCPEGSTDGCIRNLVGASDASTINKVLGICSPPTRGYPTTTSYDLWVANIGTTGNLTNLFGCFGPAGKQCNTVNATSDSYSVRVTTQTTGSLVGCVDETVNDCTAFRNITNVAWTCTFP